jgi:diguanylate cyclase (GGDEF)-like protein
MLRVVGSIAHDHDLWLVVLAGLVCLLAANTSVRLLDHQADDDTRQRVIRTGAGIIAFSAGIWTTNFILLLSLRPGLLASFDPPRSLLSLTLSVVATSIAFLIRPTIGGTAAPTVFSGLILAGGIGAMQFVGMGFPLVPGAIHHDADLVIVSLPVASVCAITAMILLAHPAVLWASLCLTLSVLLTHFIAADSVSPDLSGGIDLMPLVLPQPELAMATGAGCLLILSLTLAASLFDQHITARVAGEARRFRALADATFEGLIFERNGRIVDANSAMSQLAATEAAALIGRQLTDLIADLVPHQIERGRPVEHELRLPDGRTTPVELLWRGGPDGGEHVVAVRDISREKAAEGRLERMARFDPLTGLANRALFDRQLNRALALSDRTTIDFALLYVDLDRFETVSEALGHPVAEQVLIQAARRLEACVRETDTVARVGRDEFAIIQALTEQPADAAALADRIVAEMAMNFVVDDRPIGVTASVGVVLYPADGTQGKALIKHAMMAVRQAKNDGRGRWRYFEPGMDLLPRTKRSLEHDLRAALNEGQFSLNYQPFVETASLQVVGYEALLRWDHPERGRIPPSDFIPLAEETGLIVPIGRWVLATACAEAVSWDQTLIISVNLSPAQFLQPGIVSTVAGVLQQTGLPPDRLELEITEGTLMHDTQNALQILTSLKAIGVKIAMDDFGTGYSSLSYLRKFPFDKIKIDRSFMSDLEDDAEAETIVQAIIGLSRSLRLDVTAEGVETNRQLAMLRALGCDFVQGYLLGRPRSANQLDLHGGKPRRHVIDHAVPRLVAAPAARSA